MVNNVKPANIVGAIANEAGVESQYMGRIVIEDRHSFIDLPEGMPKAIFSDLKKTRVCGVPMRISKEADNKEPKANAGKPKKHKAKRDKKGEAAAAKRAKVKAKLKAKKKKSPKQKKRKQATSA